MFWRKRKGEAADVDTETVAASSGTGTARELAVLSDEPPGRPVAGAVAPPDSVSQVDEAPTDTPAADEAKSELFCETEEAKNASAGSAAAGAPTDVSEEQVVAALQTVFDPEIPVNIYELGLIYGVVLKPGDSGVTDVDIKMTLTSPHCPVAETLPGDVANAARTVAGVGEVDVEVVWDPTWNPDMMSEAAKLELGMF